MTSCKRRDKAQIKTTDGELKEMPAVEVNKGEIEKRQGGEVKRRK